MELMVEVGNERLASVEAGVKHLSESYDRLERSQESMAAAVVELKIIAQQGIDFNKSMHDRVLPKIDSLERAVILLENEKASYAETKRKVDKIKEWQLKKDGAIVSIVAAITLFKDQIVKFLGF
jgi:hypothetical protein